MTDDELSHYALLPAGLRDLLPPEAETEAAAVEALMAVFAGHGYQRVKPPLLEFERSLLAGSGEAVADQTFRMMDPDTHRTMGLRADMTPQVARIAATRLGRAPRPLRLSYAGQCVRVRGTQIAPDRQVAHAGIELIGHDSPAADAEVVVVAAQALRRLGVPQLSIDLTLPPFVPLLLAEVPPAGRTLLARALDRKDAAEVAAHGGTHARMLTELLLAAGPAERALDALAAAALPGPARALADRLAGVVAAVRRRAPDLVLTVDPVEFRGARYETGVSTTIYARGLQQELGRGGRYAGHDGEPATGVTLYPESVLRAAPAPAARLRAYVPGWVPQAAADAAREAGYATVAALDAAADPRAEAIRLGCTHVADAVGLVPVHEEKG